MRRSIAVALALWGMLANAAPAEAGRAEARALGEAGLAKFDRGDFEGAFTDFQRADAEYHAPTNVLFMARCRARQARLVEARRLYQAVAAEDLGPDSPHQFVEAKSAAAAEGGALDARIPIVIVTTSRPPPSAARLRIDADSRSIADLGQPIQLDPGLHTIVLEAPEHRPARHDVTLAEGGGTTRIQLELVPVDRPEAKPAPAPPEMREPVLWPAGVCFGIGGTGVITGAVAAVAANVTLENVLEDCIDNRCPPDTAPTVEKAGMLADVSTAGFVIGGVGLAAGTLLAIFPPTVRVSPPASRVRSTVLLDPELVGLTVTGDF